MPGEKVRLLKSGTLLAGRGAWISLEGLPPTTNSSSQGLERMLAIYGGRASTPVPQLRAWEMPAGAVG
jgi:hypothetical protein